MRLLKISLLLLSLSLECGCATVKPWQKKEFSKPHMALVPVPLETKLMQHVYHSKEGSFGGYGVGGGGCGCN